MHNPIDFGLDHYEVAKTMNNLAVAYGDLGDCQKKIELLERALEIKEKHYGLDHYEVAKTINNLAVAYGDLGDCQKKKEMLERALEIGEKHYGLDHYEVAKIMVNLGHAYASLGDCQKAYEFYEKLSKIIEKGTSLHFAVQSRNLETVKYILKKGADILARNNHCTVLNRAVSGGNEV